MDKALGMLGLCKKAGAVETGEYSVGAAVRSGKAKLIMTASDTAEGTAKRAINFSQWRNIPLIPLPYTKSELGDLFGKTVCAIAAITDAGLAASFVKKLGAERAEYTGAAEKLAEKSAKAPRTQSSHTGRKTDD